MSVLGCTVNPHLRVAAAEQGHASGQYNLGVMYANGQGVPQDVQQAAYWYTQAAEQGDAWGQSNLGGMYKEGQGMPQDWVIAYYLSNLAAIDPSH